MAADKAQTPGVDLDPAGKKLALDAEKATAAAIQSTIPTVENAPKGEVTVGEAAGSFGPWLAQQTLEDAAEHLFERSAGQALAEAHKAGLAVIVKEAVANGRLTARNTSVPDGSGTSLRTGRSMRSRSPRRCTSPGPRSC